MCSAPASCRYLSLALAAAAAARALVVVAVLLATPATTRQSCRPSSSPRLASVENMDNNNNDVHDVNDGGGGL